MPILTTPKPDDILAGTWGVKARTHQPPPPVEPEPAPAVAQAPADHAPPAGGGSPESPQPDETVPPPVIAAVNPVTDEGAILKAATELAAPGNPNAILHVPTTAEREGGEAGQRKFEETELVKTRLPLETWAQTQLPTLLDSGVLKLDDLATWPAFASFAPLIEKERLRQAAVVAAADAKDEAKEMRDHIAAEAAAQATEAPTSNQEPT